MTANAPNGAVIDIYFTDFFEVDPSIWKRTAHSTFPS